MSIAVLFFAFRCVFQLLAFALASRSVRHAIGRMMVNVDISSAAFYKSGPLIGLCMEYLGKSSEADPLHFLSANQLEVQTRIDLARFVRNLSVRTTGKRVGAIKDISKEEADTLTFPSGDGSTRSVHVSPMYRIRIPFSCPSPPKGMVPPSNRSPTSLPRSGLCPSTSLVFLKRRSIS